jgi:threonine synthase
MDEESKPQKRHKSGFRGPSPEVGKATQFRPGNCANPGGRPKKRPVTSALERILDDKRAEAIAQALITMASSEGKHAVAAAREIMDRLEGKVSLPVEAKLNLENMTDEEMTARIEEITRELGYVKKAGS